MILPQNLKDIKLGKSGRAVKLFCNKEPIQICTSTMYLPFGVKSVNKEWNNFSEYSIDCSLNQSSSETSVVFRDTINDLDSVINELVKANLSMFNNKNETATDSFVYSPMLRENKTYPKLMKLQLPRDKNGNFESFIFDENKHKVPVDENNITEILHKGRTFKAIIECVKVWYYNGKVGSIWKVVQLKFAEKTISDNTNTNTNTTDNQETIYSKLMIDD
jgi:hypothetical protein